MTAVGSDRRTRTSVVVGTFAAAFNLRMALVGVGPVAPDIQADTGAGSGTVGLLSAVAILCLSLVAFWGGPLVQRLGARRVVAWCMGLIAVGTAARAVMPTAWALVVATVPIGVGMALGGVALPAIVKRHFPARGGLLTGGYVASMTAGAAVIGFTIVPLGEALGGWRAAFAASSLFAAAALVVWLIAGVPDAKPELRAPGTAVPTRLLVLLVLLFGFQAIPFSTMITWVAAIYRDAGWSAGQAAIATGCSPSSPYPRRRSCPGCPTAGTAVPG